MESLEGANDVPKDRLEAVLRAFYVREQRLRSLQSEIAREAEVAAGDTLKAMKSTTKERR